MVGMTPAGTEISHSALYHVYRVHAYSIPTKMLRGFITSIMRATCLTHLIPLKLICQTISDDFFMIVVDWNTYSIFNAYINIIANLQRINV
jgi:hypothetical protein